MGHEKKPKLSREYNEERARLKERIIVLQEKLKDLDDRRYERDKFVRAIRRFMEMKMLTKNLLTGLIDRIEVHETEGVGKNRTQRVVIYYRFVGYLEIPDEQTRFSEDTRQGVSVESGVPRKRACRVFGGSRSLSPARRSSYTTATTEKKPRKKDKQKGAGKPAPVHRDYLLYLFSNSRTAVLIVISILRSQNCFMCSGIS